VGQFSRVKKKPLNGKSILITAGPTREKIDAVRFISNYSSGKMGYALAESAVSMGARVTLITGPSSIKTPIGVKVINIESTEQMHLAVLDEFTNHDCLIMAAAPADFQPEQIPQKKIKRTDSKFTLSLKPTVDILQSLTNGRRNGQIVVGFALETENAIANATKKLADKKLDAIIVNTPSDKTGYNSDTNQVSFIKRGEKPEEWPLLSKSEVAAKILAKIIVLLS
jgi:phosphopantothenoylcysteine decarboxylase/phosphopantothenate--cysteine ligase